MEQTAHDLMVRERRDELRAAGSWWASVDRPPCVTGCTSAHHADELVQLDGSLCSVPVASGQGWALAVCVGRWVRLDEPGVFNVEVDVSVSRWPGRPEPLEDVHPDEITELCAGLRRARRVARALVGEAMT